MKHATRISLIAGVFGFALLCMSDSVLACGSCYGAADSTATEGMNFAILSMLGITGSVLAGFTSFFFYLRKRAKLYLRTVDVNETTNENGGLR